MHDFSTDEGDDVQEVNENDSSCSESGDSRRKSSNRKRIKRKKVVHTQNDSNLNQHSPQLFEDLSPSFGMIPGLSNSTRQDDVSLMNSDQQLQIEQQIELVEQNVEEEDNVNSFDHDDGNNENLIHMRPNDPLPGNSEDYEFDIDRQLRLEREAENESHQTRRLLAPRNEIRQRNRPPSKRQQNNDSFQDLRERQLQLVNLQIDYTKVLLENAKITQEKCKAELLLAERMNPNNG